MRPETKTRRPARVHHREGQANLSDHAPGTGLPPGTWVKCRGIRRFVPADPTWKPSEIVDSGAESLFAKLWNEPAPIDVPTFRPFRHICDDCGCLLFGIENCPQCEWLALGQRQEREAA